MLRFIDVFDIAFDSAAHAVDDDAHDRVDQHAMTSRGSAFVRKLPAVFSPIERSHLREVLLDAARIDRRIVAAGLVGSAARGTEDRWSDIDLALRLAPGQHPDEVVRSWTSAMYENHGAVTHTDLRSGRTLYRAFLLPTSLQVDISW